VQISISYLKFQQFLDTLNVSVVRFCLKNVVKQVSEGLENAGRRKAKRLTKNDAESHPRTDRCSHSRRLRGVRLHEREPVGVDARLDLRGHRCRDLSNQPRLPEAVEPRADPATHAFRQVYKRLGHVVGCAVRVRNDRNLRCRGKGSTRWSLARARGSVADGPGHLRPWMDPCHLVHGRKSVLREDGAHPDGTRTSRDRLGTLRLYAPPWLRGLLGLDPLDAAPACVDRVLRPGPNRGGFARGPNGA